MFVDKKAGLNMPFTTLVPLQTPTVLWTIFIKLTVFPVTHSGAIVEVKVAGLNWFNWNVPELELPHPFWE